MKVSFDVKTDTLVLLFKESSKVAESDEGKPGIILDYDEAGTLVSMEILNASKRGLDARKIEYQLTG